MPTIRHAARSVLLLAAMLGLMGTAQVTAEDDYTTAIFPTLDWSEPVMLDALSKWWNFPQHRASYREGAIATDDGGMWVAAWLRNEERLFITEEDQFRSALFYRYSSDNGETWSEKGTLWLAESGTQGIQDLQLMALGKGRFIAAWISDDALSTPTLPRKRIYYRLSEDGGMSWSGTQPLNPMASADPGYDTYLRLRQGNDGELLAVWSSTRRLGGQLPDATHVFYQRSEDLGRTWTEAEYVAVMAHERYWQEMPDIFRAEDGSLHVVWVQRRGFYAAPESCDGPICMSRSEDSGASWSTPIALLVDVDFSIASAMSPQWVDTGGVGPSVLWRLYNNSNSNYEINAEGEEWWYYSNASEEIRLSRPEPLPVFAPTERLAANGLYGTHGLGNRDFKFLKAPSGENLLLYTDLGIYCSGGVMDEFWITRCKRGATGLRVAVYDESWLHKRADRLMAYHNEDEVRGSYASGMAIASDYTHGVVYQETSGPAVFVRMGRPTPPERRFGVRLFVPDSLRPRGYRIPVDMVTEYPLQAFTDDMVEIENGRVVSIEQQSDHRYKVFVEPGTLGPDSFSMVIPEGRLVGPSGQQNHASNPFSLEYDILYRGPRISCQPDRHSVCSNPEMEPGDRFTLWMGCLGNTQEIFVDQLELTNVALVDVIASEDGCLEATFELIGPGPVEVLVPAGGAVMRNGALSDADGRYRVTPKLPAPPRPSGNWSMPFELNGDAVAHSRISAYDVAQGPEGELLAAWYRREGLMWSVSHDQGLNWSRPALLADNPAPGAAPAVEIGENGIWWIFDPMGLSGPNSRNFSLYASTDEGATWYGPQDVAIARLPYHRNKDHARLTALTSGRLLLVWQSNFGNYRSLVYSYSDNFGASWTPETALFTTRSSNTLALDPHTVSVDEEGTIYLSWGATQNYAGVASSARHGYFTLSRDGGESWLAPRGAPMVPGQLGTLAIDQFRVEPGANGRLVAMWHGRKYSTTSSVSGNIYISHSDDEGVSWTPPLAIDESLGAERGRYRPLALKSDGYGKWRAALGIRAIGSNIDEIAFLESIDNGSSWESLAYLLDRPEPRNSGSVEHLSLFSFGEGAWSSVWNLQNRAAGYLSDGYLVAAVSPPVALSRPTASLRNLGPSISAERIQEVALTFSYPVWGLQADDFEVENGRVLAVPGFAYERIIRVEADISGPVSIMLPENRVERLGGFGNFASNKIDWHFESGPPQSFIQRIGSRVNEQRQFRVSVHFSSSVVGFDAGDMAIENGRVLEFSGEGSDYEVLIEAMDHQEKTVVWVPGSVAVSAGNGRPNLASEPFERDNTLREINLSISDMQWAGRGYYDITISYSGRWRDQPSVEDFVVENGFLVALPEGSDIRKWKFRLIPNGPGEVRVRGVDAAAMISAPVFAAFNPEELVIDYQPLEEEEVGPGPGVYLSSNAAMVVHGAFGVDVQFDGAVVGLQREDFLVHNGRVTGLRGVGRRYQATITPDSAGIVRVAVAEGAARTVAGARSLASRNTLARIFDDGPPLAVTITPGWTGPSNEERIDFNISFNRPVTGFVADRGLWVRHSGTAHEDITLSGGPQDFVATVSGLSGEGSFRLEIPRKGGVRDARGIPLTADARSPEVSLDTIAPTARLAAAPEWIDGELRLVLEASEALLTAPELSVAGGALKRVPKTTPLGGARYAFQLRPDTENDLHLHFLLVDLAGNVGVHEEGALYLPAADEGVPLPAAEHGKWWLATLLLLAGAWVLASVGRRGPWRHDQE